MAYEIRLPYPRTRSTELSRTSESWHRIFYEWPGNDCSNPDKHSLFWQQTGSVENVETKTMNDVVTPSYRYMQQNGQIINTPMKSVYSKSQKTVGGIHIDTRFYVTACSPPKSLIQGGIYTGTLPADFLEWYVSGIGWASIPTIDVQDYVDIAVTQMWANADHSKAAALATLGEARETIHSMVSIFGRLIKVLIAIKKLDTVYLFKQFSPKELASRYMELRYALRPLYYDTKQIIDAANHRKLDYDRFTFRGKASTSGSNELSGVHNDRYGTFSIHYHYTGRTTRTIEVRSGLLTHVDEPSLLNLWGFDSIAETAWELLPFSFIIDWFFNVGQTIASWTPETGLKPLASWYTLVDTVYQTSTVSHMTFETDPSKNYVSPSCFIAPMTKTLTTVTKTRVPEPRRSILPTFNLKLDLLKLIDLLIIGKNILR